ncbi:MAG TPA: hypothetical protein VLG74_04285, partial [Blastocatellia bacterium]|nr:hypothetical protein [Blastocatellia bacterium]
SPTAPEENFEQWVSNRFGYRLYEIFFKTYTEKVWGLPCSEISADWAAQRIKNLSLKEAVTNALFGSRNGNVITSLIEEFHYPRLGPGMMWERCEQLVGARGVQTVRGVEVEKVRHRGRLVESVVGLGPSKDKPEFAADHFISTMPLRELIHALEPAPPAVVLEAADRLRYRDYLTVALIVKKESVFADNWIYIHSPDVRVGRIQNYKNWSPEMVPDSSRTSLGLEYFLWEQDEMWTWSNDRLIEFGIKECAKIGLIEPDDVEDGTVVRMKKAYPIYDHNYRGNLATIRQYLETFSNLQTIGRNGLHRYNNQDHSMLTGIYAARNISGEKLDVWSVNTEMEYHEDGRASISGERLVPLGVVPSPSSVPAEKVIEVVFAKLDPVALGTAMGVIAGLGLFLVTALLMLTGGDAVRRTLSLLGQYLFGFEATWKGAGVGLIEAGLGGFALGYLIASLRNGGLVVYSRLVRRRAQADAERELLDKV